MPLLEHAEVLSLHATAVSAGLAESRRALLSGIDAHLAAALPCGASASEQILCDLAGLNTIGAVADGSVPLVTWIDNAATLTKSRMESAVFQRAAHRCRRFTLFVCTTLDPSAPHHRVLAGIVHPSNGYVVGRIGATEVGAHGAAARVAKSSDLVIIVVGGDPGSPEERAAVPWLQLVHEASARERKPVLVFMERIPHRRSPKPPPSALADLRLRLLGNRLVDYYDGPEDLGARVDTALRNWKFQYEPGVSSTEQSLPPQPLIQHPYPLDRHFSGRSIERGELTAWFDAREDNVLVLEALGGLGKSALAWFWVQFDVLGAPGPGMSDSHVEERKAPRRTDEGVFWWSFYEMNSRFPEFLVAVERYARGTNRPEPAGTGRDRVGRLLDLLRERRLLLVLDGFERELYSYSKGYNPSHGDAPPEGDLEEARRCIDPDAARFLQAAASMTGLMSRILITSRLFPTELEGRGGKPLAGCRRMQLGNFRREDAVELFAQSEIRATPDEVDQLARKYGYHPLALRLLIGVIVGDPFDSGDIGATRDYDPIPHLIRREHHVLHVAYHSLSAQNKALLSGIAAYRGPVDERAIEVVEAARARTSGDAARDRAALKLAVRSLLVRNLLMREERRGVFDLHPVVRQYAYDRLVNKRSTHLTISHYFRSFAADLEVATRDDMNPVIELFHQQVAAERADDALLLLFERIFTPLVREFHDIRTAVELFSAMVPTDTPMESTWNDGDLAGWFNRQYGLLLRRAGFVERAYEWSRLSRESPMSRFALYSATLHELAERSGQENIDLVRTLRETGRFAQALKVYQTDLRRVHPASQLALDIEHALTLAYIGRSEDAERFVAEAARGLERLCEGEIVCVRALRYWSTIALLAQKPDVAMEHVAAAEAKLRRRARTDLETWEERVAVAVQHALALVTLSRRAADDARRRAAALAELSTNRVLSWRPGSLVRETGADASSRAQRLDELVTSLHRESRICRERGMIETEIDVSFALACALLISGDVEAAARHADLVVMLSTRGGLRVRSLDGTFLLSAIAARRGDLDEARRLAEDAARASRKGDHEYRSLAVAVLNPAGNVAGDNGLQS